MNEITTTVSELLVTSRQIAGSAQQVAHIAEETLKAAQAGDQAVLQSQGAIEGIRRQVDTVVSHMLNLGKKSQQIGGVLDIINELAEQTNILSINATIEAAGQANKVSVSPSWGGDPQTGRPRIGLDERKPGAGRGDPRGGQYDDSRNRSGVQSGGYRAAPFRRTHARIQTDRRHGGHGNAGGREIGLSTKQQMTAVEQVNAAISSAAQVTRETEASSAQTLQTATQLAQLSQNLSRLVQSRATA